MVRIKNRYLLCEIIRGDGHQESYDIYSAIILSTLRKSIISFHGDYGNALLRSSLSLKYYNSKTNMVLIRAARGKHKLLQSAMIFIQRIGNVDAFFNTIHIGGTIRSCQKYLLKYNKQQLRVLLASAKTKVEKKEIRKTIRQCSLVKADPHFRKEHESEKMDMSD